MSDYKTIKLTTLGLAVMRSKEMPTLRLKAEWIQAERKLTRVPPLMDRASRRTRNRSNQVQTSTSSTRTPSRQAPSRQAPSRQAPSRQAPSRQAPSRQSSMRPVPTTSHQRSPIVNQKSMDELTLESKLKQYRLEQARLRDLPAFTIFSNQVLHALIEAKPYNQQTFLAIRGLGPSKWAQFGQPILKIIEDHSS